MKTTMIKKVFLTAMMLMSYASVQASGLDSTMIIPLKPVGQGGPGGGGDDHGGHHAPVQYIAPPSVVYDLDAQELVFTGAATQATFTYYIKEEDTEVTVDYGTMTLGLGEEDSVSLASLSAGVYTILIQVGAYWYGGEFTKEEE